MQRAKYPILSAPFHGARVPVMLRELTEAQILSCGDFSLIETFADRVARKSAKLTMAQVVAYAERQEAVARAALVHPTYDEIMECFGGDTQHHAAVKEQEKLAAQVAEMPDGRERHRLEERLEALRVWIDLLLPDDFLAFVVGYSLGIDKSDIKTVSEEMLINAAVLAERGHDNPSDHIKGAFTDFMRDDINARAWLLLQEKRERKHRDE